MDNERYGDSGGDYHPNEAFAAVLERKAALDNKMWPREGPGR